MRCKRCGLAQVESTVVALTSAGPRETPLCRACVSLWHGWLELIYGGRDQFAPFKH